MGTLARICKVLRFNTRQFLATPPTPSPPRQNFLGAEVQYCPNPGYPPSIAPWPLPSPGFPTC